MQAMFGTGNEVDVMNVLIGIVAGDIKNNTFERVLDAIQELFFYTQHTCTIFVATESKDVKSIEICKKYNVVFKAINFIESQFERTTSFSLNGYDELQLHRITFLRNMCIDQATAEGVEYLFFIDTDNVVDKKSLDTLIASGRKDIAGWYYLKNVPSTSAGRFIPRGDKPFKVGATACGCRLIHSDIFNNAEFKYRNLLSEETQFSIDIQKLGFETWIHPEVYSDHIGGGYTDEARTYRETQLDK